jgi:hypothetical protein
MALMAPGQARMNPSFAPTPEQAAIMDAFGRGDKVVAEALAGTGKTTTLKAISGIQPTRPGTYLAFNKSIVRGAEGSFPGRVNVTTAHSLAYKAVGHTFGHRLPGNPGATRMSARKMASYMKIKPAQLDTGTLTPTVVTRMAQATVAAYIKSADTTIGPKHIPSRILAHLRASDICEIVLPVADRIWADLSNTNGKFFFTHDVYLKHWQLTNPVIASDYIMFDEAQDSDPVIASIVARQAAQLVYVGDRNQAIYGWRGAVDSMSKVEGATRLPLTKSFRFGPAIAEAANQWLGMLGSDLRVVGHDPVKSVVGPLTEPPRAILCRTNGTALGWVLAFHARGIKVALAPGDRSAGKDIERFAWAARDLMAGEGTDHPDLVGFTTWSEVVTYAEEEEDGADLKRLVGIINRIGYPAVIDAIRGLSLEENAQVTVSTAHKAKGLEWNSVQVADDFTPPEPDAEEPVDPADLMLAYVTVTRAKLNLDPGSLGEPQLWRP